MYCIDFEYDGIRLSDLNSVICCIDESADLKTVGIGSELTLNTVNTTTSNKFRIVSTQYDSAYTTTFEIGKFACGVDNYVYSEKEIAFIMRWLNRKEYLRFKPIFEDLEYSDMHMMGTFTEIEVIKIGDDVIGFHLTLTTDSPYAFYGPVKATQLFGTFGPDNAEVVRAYYGIDLDDASSAKKSTLPSLIHLTDPLVIHDQSDETGYIYPKVTIECMTDGQVLFSNSRQVELDKDDKTVIYNCVAGEIITIDGDTKQIYSSEAHSTLYNDFNWHYPKVMNDFRNTENRYTLEIMTGRVTIEYSPICKAIGI